MTAWVSLPSTDTDADSPGDIDLASKLIQRNQHLYEFITGGTQYDGKIPHDHSGEADAVTHAVASQNLLANPCVAGFGAEFSWSGSGFSRDGTTGAMAGGTADTHYMYQNIGASQFGTTDGTGLFGTNGAPLVVSFFAKVASSASQGTLQVGFSDGSTSTFDTGHRFELPHTSLTTSFKRFWAYHDDSSPATAWAGAGYSTNMRFLCRVKSGDAFDQTLHVSGFQVCASLGTLSLFNWPGHEKQADGWTFHGSGESVPDQVPLFDTTVAITNAVELTTRA